MRGKQSEIVAYSRGSWLAQVSGAADIFAQELAQELAALLDKDEVRYFGTPNSEKCIFVGKYVANFCKLLECSQSIVSEPIWGSK